MSAKLGTIIGLYFIFMAFLFGVDLVMMQYCYANLDSIAIQASYLISKNGYLTPEVEADFLNKHEIRIYPFETNKEAKSYEEGFMYGYVLEKEYSPIVISSAAMNIKVERYTIINVYK